MRVIPSVAIQPQLDRLAQQTHEFGVSSVKHDGSALRADNDPQSIRRRESCSTSPRPVFSRCQYSTSQSGYPSWGGTRCMRSPGPQRRWPRSFRGGDRAGCNSGRGNDKDDVRPSGFREPHGSSSGARCVVLAWEPYPVQVPAWRDSSRFLLRHQCQRLNHGSVAGQLSDPAPNERYFRNAQ